MRTPLAIAAALFVVLAAALVAAKSASTLHPSLSREQAKAAVLADPATREFLRDKEFTNVKIIALDQTHWRVTVLDHGRSLLDASTGPGGRIDAIQPHPPGVHATGSNILWNRPLMIGLALLFVAATAVLPLRRVRNLDALVIGGGLLGVLLAYDSRVNAADAYAGAAVLVYLIGRCAHVGLRGGPATTAERPLYAVVFERLPSASRKRIAILVTSALVFAGALITVTSTGLSDVAFAGMAGATSMQRGDPPYGHVTNEVVHGDTYPIFTYVLFVPFSLISPVDDSFDNLDGALWLNALALVGAALAAFLLGSRTTSRGDSAYGLALVVAWLACPAVLMASSGGGNDVPTAFLVMAGLALAAQAALSSGALALATAAKLGPVAALVVWIAWLRGSARRVAIAVTAAVAAACLVLLLALGGPGAIPDMLDALAFQFRRGSFHSVWTQIGSSGAQAVCQALVLTFVVMATAMVARSGAGWSLRRVCALAGAGVLGLQLAANYWTFAYFPWALPFILVALFPPERRRSQPSAPPAP